MLKDSIMSFSDEVFIVIESGQRVKLQESTINVWESGKVEPYLKKENFRSNPYFLSSSPSWVSSTGSAHMSPVQSLRRNNPKSSLGQFIQISEITPNNIIRFLSNFGLNPNSLSTWDEYDVSKFLKHPYLNLMSYDILESIWNRYCYKVTSTTCCCFNGDNINGITLIYICLGKRDFHYYTQNQFLNFNDVIKPDFMMCKCTRKIFCETKYNNGKRLSYLVKKICQCFLERSQMIDTLLSR